jgi:hypothetical protein
MTMHRIERPPLLGGLVCGYCGGPLLASGRQAFPHGECYANCDGSLAAASRFSGGA